MQLTCNITITGDAMVYDHIKAREQERERSRISVDKDTAGIVVHIEASDATAFRASMNAITQSLAIYGGIHDGKGDTRQDNSTSDV